MDQANSFFPKEFYDQDELVSAYKILIKETVSFINPNIRNLDSQINSIFEIEKEFATVAFIFLFINNHLIILRFFLN